MGDFSRSDVLGDPITEFEQIDAAEQMLSRAEQHLRHGKMHLVHEGGCQILSNGADAAAEADVQAVGRLEPALQRRFPVGIVGPPIFLVLTNVRDLTKALHTPLEAAMRRR